MQDATGSAQLWCPRQHRDDPVSASFFQDHPDPDGKRQQR